MTKRTELFMTAESAVMYLMRYGYRQDDGGEWYRREYNHELHARIERRKNGAAIKFSDPVEM